jgi:hypothetical protein
LEVFPTQFLIAPSIDFISLSSDCVLKTLLEVTHAESRPTNF